MSQVTRALVGLTVYNVAALVVAIAAERRRIP